MEAWRLLETVAFFASRTLHEQARRDVEGAESARCPEPDEDAVRAERAALNWVWLAWRRPQ